MPELPSQIDFQQSHARSVSPGDLEVMGKRASAAWAAGQFPTLGEAVIDRVKSAGLSPEQVRRVIEFANTDAFLEAFHKLGTDHRYVDFGGGVLADPRDVIRDLNDGGGGGVFDRGTADYDAPPRTKRASVDPEAEIALYAAFQTDGGGEAIPFENPSGWVWDVRDKLAGATQHLTSMVGGLEVAYQDCALNLRDQVKLAAREGAELGQIVQAWSTVTDDPTYMKVAFQMLTPHLLREGCYDGIDGINRSIEKTGSARTVNPEHPLVTTFHDYCEVLHKLAEVRQDRDRMADKLAKVNYAIKRFGDDMDKVAGAVGNVMKSFGQMGDAARHSIGGGLGEATGLAIKAAPVVGGAVAAKSVYDLVSTNPTVMKANMYVNPASDAYAQQKAIRRQQAQQQLFGGDYGY